MGKEKALILIDLENEWIDKNSEYFVGNISELISKTNKLIKYCRDNNYKIIFITHIEKDSKKEFAENSENVQIIKDIHKKNSDILIKKFKISPFYNTSLEKDLKGIKEVVVCGILTNLCVRSFVEGAYDREFDITIIDDCCVAFDDKTHKFTLRDLKSTREEIKILNLEEFVNQ